MPGAPDGRTGRILGDRYELLSVIGTGASAEVYHARDLRLGRSVAVKQLRSGYTDDPRFLKLFRAEATLAAQLTHPNILTVFDWSDDGDGTDGGAYLVTQLLSGGTLRGVLNAAGAYDDDGNLLRAGTLSLSQVGFIGLQASQGLAFAHEQGLVHRDIKPANLLFGQDGRVHIGDFGIARAVAEAAWTEPEGVLIGTARYAAPEQATDARIDGLADVYSLTLCLVEALTGEIPLVRENALGTMVQRQKVDIPVDDSYGPLAEVLAMGGRSDAARRASSEEFLGAMLEACRELPDPEPLALLDLTDLPATPSDAGSAGEPGEPGEDPPGDHEAGAAAERSGRGNGHGSDSGGSNVTVNGDGSLVIAGDEDSDLRLPPQESDDELARSTGSGRATLVSAPLASTVGSGMIADLGADVGGDPTADPYRAAATGFGHPEPGTDLQPAQTPAAKEGTGPALDSDGVEPEARPNRRSGRWVRRLALLLVALALAAGAVVGGILLSQTQVETATITVAFPIYEVGDYDDLSPNEVAESVAPLGWRLDVSERHRDGTVPGELLSQQPAPGTVLAPGSDQVIALVYSLGPELRATPELVGAGQEAAAAAIDSSGLELGEITTRNDESVPAGEVLAATIEGEAIRPGDQYVTGTAVDLVVSAGPAPREVPNVSILKPEQARASVAEVDLELVIIEEFSRQIPEGDIIRQAPDPGTFLARGENVTIVVSQGLPFVEVPTVAGMTTAAASAELEDLEFAVTGVVGSPSNPVVRTDPAEGESLRLGSRVTIYTE